MKVILASLKYMKNEPYKSSIGTSVFTAKEADGKLDLFDIVKEDRKADTIFKEELGIFQSVEKEKSFIFYKYEEIKDEQMNAGFFKETETFLKEKAEEYILKVLEGDMENKVFGGLLLKLQKDKNRFDVEKKLSEDE